MLSKMAPTDLYNILAQMKALIEQNFGQARQILAQNPQLTKALFQAQIILGLVQPMPGMVAPPQQQPQTFGALGQHPMQPGMPPQQQQPLPMQPGAQPPNGQLPYQPAPGQASGPMPQQYPPYSGQMLTQPGPGQPFAPHQMQPPPQQQYGVPSQPMQPGQGMAPVQMQQQQQPQAYPAQLPGPQQQQQQPYPAPGQQPGFQPAPGQPSYGQPNQAGHPTFAFQSCCCHKPCVQPCQLRSGRVSGLALNDSRRDPALGWQGPPPQPQGPQAQGQQAAPVQPAPQPPAPAGAASSALSLQQQKGAVMQLLAGLPNTEPPVQPALCAFV